MNIRITDTKTNISKLAKLLDELNYTFKVYNNRDNKEQRLYINIDSYKIVDIIKLIKENNDGKETN